MELTIRSGEVALKRAAESGKSFSDRVDYFGVEDGEQKMIRFLTDLTDWTDSDGVEHRGLWETEMHNFMPTRPSPDGHDKWPKAMSAVCRNDPMFNGYYSDCYICSHMRDPYDSAKPATPARRLWGVAVLREEIVDGGKIIGFRDVMKTVKTKRDGKEVEETVPCLVWVNQAHKTFFAPLKGQAEFYGTLLDRDFIIKRSGKGQDTTYIPVPMPPIEVTLPDGSVINYDMRDPRCRSIYEIPSIEDHVVHLSDDEHYATFFDVRVPNPAANRTVQQSASPQEQQVQQVAQQAPTNEATSADLTALRDRVIGYPVAPVAPVAPAPAVATLAPQALPVQSLPQPGQPHPIG